MMEKNSATRQNLKDSNSIKQTTKSVAHMNLGCRFSFWLLVDSRYIKSILPKTRAILLRKWRLCYQMIRTRLCSTCSKLLWPDLLVGSANLINCRCVTWWRGNAPRGCPRDELPRQSPFHIPMKQPTQSRPIDVKARTGWTDVRRSTTPSGIERTSVASLSRLTHKQKLHEFVYCKFNSSKVVLSLSITRYIWR
jgi:hypothetical protein